MDETAAASVPLTRGDAELGDLGEMGETEEDMTSDMASVKPPTCKINDMDPELATTTSQGQAQFNSHTYNSSSPSSHHQVNNECTVPLTPDEPSSAGDGQLLRDHRDSLPSTSAAKPSTAARGSVQSSSNFKASGSRSSRAGGGGTRGGCGAGGSQGTGLREEKHGLLHFAIPVMPLPVAAVLCLLNIVAPGVGTLLASFSCFCCGHTRVGRPVKGFGLNLLAAVLQMLTFFLIVGWIWSILWGMTFVQLALCSEKNRKMSVSYYVRRQSSVE